MRPHWAQLERVRHGRSCFRPVGHRLPSRKLDGYVGIQNHSGADQVAFRNIRIKELGTQPYGS
ncbi:hypothetical protein [Acrocarpospora sp. B8E8]|uniref:hypothetical protein n=1 Tax=Acrocarpospora sp. B8E8 TaxID=3153572 RepID=UPI00325D7EB3